MERGPFVIATTERGSIAVSAAAITQIVGAAAAESYGVVALAGRGRFSRLVPWGIKKGVDVDLGPDGLAIELRVVVEHGVKLAGVAVRHRVHVEVVDAATVGLEILERAAREMADDLELHQCRTPSMCTSSDAIGSPIMRSSS